VQAAAFSGPDSRSPGIQPKRCVVVSAGSFSPIPLPEEGDFVIACDRGYTYCRRMGILPDLLISDFDSYAGPVDAAVPLHSYPSEKDDTDTMLAVRYAAEHGFRELLLCCALGGRLDHLVANLQALVFARRHGLSASLKSEETEIDVLLDEKRSFPRRDGWSLSVFAADGPCRVSIAGAKYPLHSAELKPSFPLGVSNQWAEKEAEISAEDGLLLVIQSKMVDDGGKSK